ncbi:unnamed protein product [Lepeophtheirus salmonis]|uniref:(salmon louse) hypothetical protein n=1 Tax=Lepeophtheirus salmonis TaxID=72036 RepID=A0A7R8H073_LEPSM|nr:unnamed protein product [Lepeophtheirus salmonis]CAF2780471.1 unnamed protein product [Lepeophtheirus salmonis]
MWKDKFMKDSLKLFCPNYGITPFDPTLNAEEEKRGFSMPKNTKGHFQTSAPIPSLIQEEDVIPIQDEEAPSMQSQKLRIHKVEPKNLEKHEENLPRRVFGNYRMALAMGNQAETEIENLKENLGSTEKVQMRKKIQKRYNDGFTIYETRYYRPRSYPSGNSSKRNPL